jgi:hypothetical protein
MTWLLVMEISVAIAVGFVLGGWTFTPSIDDPQR